MSSLYFRYGAMGSSKTANALMVKYNYEEKGQKVLLVKPATDTRDGVKTIKSRIGLSSECTLFNSIDYSTINEYDAVIVDEAQFLTEEQVLKLVDIVDNHNIPVLCYGLRTDANGDFFPGSHSLMKWADKIEEIKTICWCGKKATHNARFNEFGKLIKDGEQIVLGGNEKYTSLCRKHWIEEKLFKTPKNINELRSLNILLNEKNFIPFFHPVGDTGVFSQWYKTNFIVDNVLYSTAEQFMMAEKARLFNDEETLRKILSTDDPKEVKALGRLIKNFDQETWENNKYDIVVKGNYAKFSQNSKLKEYLLNTKNKILAEASPYDKIWGIGLDKNNENAYNPKTWEGENLLGFALMEVRDML